VAFWDSSAAIGLCLHQRSTAGARRLIRRDEPLVVWWGTPVEMCSAFARLLREGAISSAVVDQALSRLKVLRRSWREVLPGDRVRELAESVLFSRSLRGGDVLQLAAALVWSREAPRKRLFVCYDERLSAAAQDLGFTVARPV